MTARSAGTLGGLPRRRPLENASRGGDNLKVPLTQLLARKLLKQLVIVCITVAVPGIRYCCWCLLLVVEVGACFGLNRPFYFLANGSTASRIRTSTTTNSVFMQLGNEIPGTCYVATDEDKTVAVVRDRKKKQHRKIIELQSNMHASICPEIKDIMNDQTV